MADDGWVGVDADKTLFVYDGTWRGPGHFGQPIPLMVARVRQHLTNGDTVKLFTARVSDPEWEPAGREGWESLSMYLFDQVLEATNVKDYKMTLLYDDKAIQIVENTGELAIEVAVRKAYGDRRYAQRTES